MVGLWIAIGIVIGLIVGGGGIYFFLSSSAKNLVGAAKTDADRIREMARKEAETLAKEVALAARQEQVRLKQEFDKEHEAERRQMKEQEQRLGFVFLEIGRA